MCCNIFQRILHAIGPQSRKKSVSVWLGRDNDSRIPVFESGPHKMRNVAQTHLRPNVQLSPELVP
jgi:hypothetical protein